MKNIKIMVVVVLVLVIISLTLILDKNNSENINVSSMGSSQIMELEKEAESYLNGSQGYDIAKADIAYNEILNIEPLNERALFQSARVRYIQGRYESAKELIVKYKEAYPTKKRIYYISGLVNAYAKDLVSSEEDFKEFVKSDIVNEAGFLDLAWVQFQRGDFENAKINLEKGIEFTGGEGNAWLHTSMGAVLINLDQKDEALLVLQKAKNQSEVLSEKVWAINYSINDAGDYKKDIEKMAKIIDFNILVARGEETGEEFSRLEKTEGLYIEALSPNGEQGGFAVSACCATNDGTECESDTNVCGEKSTGTYNCSNVCSEPVVFTGSSEWKGDDASDVCAGNPFTQERCGGRDTKTLIGTEISGSSLPLANEVCAGYEFIQSNCGEKRIDTGTKSCGSRKPENCTERGDCNSVCSSTTTTSGINSPSQVCSGERYLVEECNNTRVLVGTKDCGEGVGTITNPNQIENNVIDLECSTDKVTWNNCSSTVKLSFQDQPFYVRNINVGSETTCSTDTVNVVGVQGQAKNFFVSRIDDTNAHKVNVVGFMDTDIFAKDFYGVCGEDVASKSIKIKVIDVETVEI
jgi:tetratricopeptide (TPR) repeat protein